MDFEHINKYVSDFEHLWALNSLSLDVNNKNDDDIHEDNHYNDHNNTDNNNNNNIGNDSDD